MIKAQGHTGCRHAMQSGIVSSFRQKVKRGYCRLCQLWRICFWHLAGTLEDIRSDGRLVGGHTDYRHYVVYEPLSWSYSESSGKNMARSRLVYRFCRYSLGNRPLSGRYYQFLLCSAYTGLLSDRRCTGGNCSLENPFVRLCPKDKIRRRTQ